MNDQKSLNLILKYLGNDKVTELDSFVENVKRKDFIEFSSIEEVRTFFIDYLTDFYNNNSKSDIDNIRTYTGIAFKRFNSLLRGIWNYDTNGLLTNEMKSEYLNSANKLSECIAKSSHLPSNIKTYRGVSLDSFKGYGISSLENLKSLKNKYYYESGFTSTSLIRDMSFFNRELEYHEFCNIEIEYLIIEEANDGIPLINDDLSYSKMQSEYLINKGSLSKIIDVEISPDGKLAHIKAVLIPKKLWDISYNKTSSHNFQKKLQFR